MTAREWMKVHYPENVGDDYEGGVYLCPRSYQELNILMKDDHDKCPFETMGKCARCWDREIPGTEEKENKNMKPTTRRTKAELLEEIGQLKKELENVEKYRKYEECANELHAIMTSFIDAGFTREEAFTMLTTTMKALAR